MWHPVGALPARVYWRRRLLVLALLLAVLGGVAWLGIALLTGRDGDVAAAGEQSRASARIPALDRVVPSLARVATPTPHADRAVIVSQVSLSAQGRGGEFVLAACDTMVSSLQRSVT